MDQLEEKLRKIVLAGIGAIASTVEKSKDALVEFAGSDQAKSLADKGEKMVQSAIDAGSQAYKRVKDALSESEVKERVRKEKERLKGLAQQVRDLSEDQREVFDAMLAELKNKKAETSYGPAEGKHPPSEDALGKPGVTESDFDLPHDNIRDPNLLGKSRKVPFDPVTPTAPDDEHNSKRVQTNTMNEHLKQNVPPDF